MNSNEDFGQIDFVLERTKESERCRNSIFHKLHFVTWPGQLMMAREVAATRVAVADETKLQHSRRNSFSKPVSVVIH